MATSGEKNDLLGSTALQNNEAVLQTREEVERELRITREALQLKSSELARSQSLWQTALESTSDGILAINLSGEVTVTNEALRTLWGIPIAVMAHGQGIDLWEILARQCSEPSTLLEAVDAARQTNEPTAGELLLSDGRIFEYRSRLPPIGEETTGRVWTFRDITERRRFEELLHRSEQRFARFMQRLPGLAWIKDGDGRYIYANDLALAAFQKSSSEILGHTDIEVFPPETAAQFMRNDQLALASSAGIQVVETLLHADGIVHHSVVSKFPLPREPGEAPLVGGIAIDITEQKRIEESLREADRRKDEFLAMLAHELRNPLAPVRAGLEVLRLDGVEHDSIDVMREQVEHLIRLVDDLLDVSRMMRGKVSLRRETVDLVTVLQRSIDSVRPLLMQKRHQLTLSTPAHAVWIDADPVRMVQVIANLINNAAKYTEPGGQFRLSVTESEGNVSLSVKDNGIGIDPDLVPHVFDLFTQADRSLERAEGGLGIGLTLVKSLVELHRGTVSAFSAGLGQGSEFIVTLPVAEQPSVSPATSEDPPESIPRRILLVDDNVGTTKIQAMLLKKLGEHEVRLAHDGPTAIQLAREFLPDVVLLDIGLPQMSGYDVARCLRQDTTFHNTLLVALTGYGTAEDRRRSMEAGFDLHLVKPPALQTLQRVLTLRKGDPTTWEGLSEESRV